jgi:multisubunit Na+/H+ antiporter MnhB subunit
MEHKCVFSKISMGAGILSSLLGVFIIITQNSRVLSNAYSDWQNMIINFILAETIFTIIFLIITLYLLSLSLNQVKTAGLSLVAGMLRITVLVISLIGFWKPGWYNVLDPQGSSAIAILLVVLSFVQGISLLGAGIKKD